MYACCNPLTMTKLEITIYMYTAGPGLCSSVLCSDKRVYVVQFYVVTRESM